ncbi:MAG: HAD-IA family hydrolase [Propionibacteriaceae bacterium]|nr:HAD-IA family hydrolase [Propionibacteriaceae bacterium]
MSALPFRSGPGHRGSLAWADARAVLFDLDGVLTPTNRLHEQAWEIVLSGFCRCRGLTPDYTTADYFAHVDGKPRLDGIRDFLASRDCQLPDGHPDDTAGDDTAWALANRKNNVFHEILRRDGIEPYPGTSDVLADARRHAKLAVVSSSRNAVAVLDAAGLADSFAIVVDGQLAEREKLPGKPDPSVFCRAAALLGVRPEDSAVVEDALSGVAAGRAGGFGLVVGVDRGAGHDALRRSGADLVVSDLRALLDGWAEAG